MDANIGRVDTRLFGVGEIFAVEMLVRFARSTRADVCSVRRIGFDNPALGLWMMWIAYGM